MIYICERKYQNRSNNRQGFDFIEIKNVNTSKKPSTYMNYTGNYRGGLDSNSFLFISFNWIKHPFKIESKWKYNIL